MPLFLSVFMLLIFTGSVKAGDFLFKRILPAQTGGIIFESQEYAFWDSVGVRAAEEALSLMTSSGGSSVSMPNLIAMTNAGYAEISGTSTLGTLDGLVEITGVSLGQHRLLEIDCLSFL